MKIVLLLALLSSFSVKGQILIRNVSIVDVENKKILQPGDVLVTNGIISEIGKNISAPKGIEIVDGTGKWLMPGLTDAHVHFFQSGGIYTRPDAINLTKYKAFDKEINWVHKNMERFLRRYLVAGITSVIDVGSTIAFLQQRDSFRTKNYSPSVFMTGPLLTTYEPPAFRNLGDNAPFFLMKSPEEGRAYVQKQLPLKPDFIKIWYILSGTNADSSAKANLPLMQAVIDEAHKNGLRVAVHATELVAARLAVEAGADFLVHSVEDKVVDDGFISLLKSKGTVLTPTMVVTGNYGRSLGQSYVPSAEDYHYAHPHPLNTMFDMSGFKDTAMTQRYKRNIRNAAAYFKSGDSIRSENLRKLSAAGVLITTGTDAGNIGTQHVSSYFDELRAMQQAGMNTWSLLVASTINGAKVLGKQNEFGAVKKGLRADLLLLSKDPAAEIDNWKSIYRVINKGIVLVPDSIVKPTPEELADRQLVAYNAHNLEAFLEVYSDDVQVYDLNTNKLEVQGKEAMRKYYSFLSNVEVLQCNLLNRIVQGNIVIDHEEIIVKNGKFYGVAIYEVKNGKIVKVWFPDL